jgi:hypothetical protein
VENDVSKRIELSVRADRLVFVFSDSSVFSELSVEKGDSVENVVLV